MRIDWYWLLALPAVVLLLVIYHLCPRVHILWKRRLVVAPTPPIARDPVNSWSLLEGNRSFLIDNLKLSGNNFLDLLVQDRLINQEEYDRITGTGMKTADKVRVLISDMLPRGNSPDKFRDFLDALRSTGQGFIADKLLDNQQVFDRFACTAAAADTPLRVEDPKSFADGYDGDKRSTGNGRERSVPDLESVIRTVARQGSRRYYEIGIKLGLNHFQITEIEQGLDSDDKKLRAIVENRRKHMEDETVLQELLDACMNIVPPIYKAVQQELQKQGKQLAGTVMVEAIVREAGFHKIVRTLLQHYSSRWYAIGLQLGLKDSTILSLTSSIPDSSDKFFSLIEHTLQAAGGNDLAAATRVLEACASLDSSAVRVISKII